MEEFFFSLEPPVMRSVLDVAVLKNFYTFLKESQNTKVKTEEGYLFHIKEDSQFFYMAITATDPSFKFSIVEATRAWGRKKTF